MPDLVPVFDGHNDIVLKIAAAGDKRDRLWLHGEGAGHLDLPRMLASALVMGGLLLGGSWMLRANYAEQAGFLAAAWGLLLLVTGGALSFFAIAHVSKAMRFGEIKTMLKR